ncbi:MAG: hypothetical protein RBR28_02005 [Lentimicrobium sp.]|jgi:hypothetical protein|nr:hypothetical protein [Lentimicrobium sp.]
MKKSSIVLIVFLTLTLSSCTHYYYIPNAQNVPLFQEKNEFHGTIAVGGGQEISTTEVQAAYAITDNLALMANFASARGGEKSDINWGRGKYLEGAVGYYKPFDEILVAEVYAGLGVSNQYHQYGTKDYNNGIAELSFVKYFLQPSVGVAHRAFDIAISTRFSRVSFFDIDNKITMDNSALYHVDTIARNKVSYMFEPALTIRGGWKNVKVQLQFSHSKNLTHPNLQFEKSNGSLGLFFTIANRYRKTVPED